MHGPTCIFWANLTPFSLKLSERAWREFFLPPFYGAAEAGVSGYMCSYSSITFTDHPERSSNTPACANKYMLHDVLRGEWQGETDRGFRGLT